MSGFSGYDWLDMTQNSRRIGSVPALAIVSFCEVVEVSLIVMVITSSWRDYRKANRSCSLFGFFRLLVTMRKVKRFDIDCLRSDSKMNFTAL